MRARGEILSGNEISVIVCVYDLARWQQIKECLASLREQTYRPAKVIVVVDGCPPLAEALRGSTTDEVLVELPTNQGLSIARNAGIEQVETPWVAFLDDDAVAEPTWLERLDVARRATGAVGVGGWVEPRFEGPAPRWFPPHLLWTVGCSHKGLPTTRSFVRNVFGGCALMSTDALRHLGGYDPSLGRRGDSAEGGEEADLCIRINRVDPSAKFLLEPSARIHHHVPQSRASVGYVLRRCYTEGRSKRTMSQRLGSGSLSSETTFVKSVGPDMLRLIAQGKITQALMLLAGVLAAGVGYVTTRPRSAPSSGGGDN